MGTVAQQCTTLQKSNKQIQVVNNAESSHSIKVQVTTQQKCSRSLSWPLYCRGCVKAKDFIPEVMIGLWIQLDHQIPLIQHLHLFPLCCANFAVLQPISVLLCQFHCVFACFHCIVACFCCVTPMLLQFCCTLVCFLCVEACLHCVVISLCLNFVLLCSTGPPWHQCVLNG